MRKKGFTLIELLAVIIILAIIALIAVPVVLNIIENTRKKSFINSSYGIVRAAENGFATDMLDGEPVETIYMYKNGVPKKIKSNIALEYDGKSPQSGTVVINNYGDVAIAISDGRYCAEKNYDDSKIILTNKKNNQCKLNNIGDYFLKTFGGYSYDYFNDIISIDDGYLVVGTSESSDRDLSGLRKGYFDGVIVKYNNGGNILWKKTLGGSYSENLEAIKLAPDGYVVVGGAQSTDGDLTGLNIRGDRDALIVKYDFDNNIVWKNSMGGYGDESFNDVVVVSDGYVAVGYSYSDEFDLQGIAKGGRDAIIVKYDKNGNMLWKKTFGGSSDDAFESIVSVNNTYIVVGYSYSNDQDLEGLNKGFDDAIIVKYDSSGNVIWKKNFGSGFVDTYEDIISEYDGVVTVGKSCDKDYDLEDVPLKTYYCDGIIVKYDFNGNIIFKKVFVAPRADGFSKIKPTDDGYILVGYAENGKNIVDPYTVHDDAMIVKYDKAWNVVWYKYIGGSNNDYFESVLPTNDGYIAIGCTKSDDYDLEGTPKKFDYYDALIVKFDLEGNFKE